MTTHTCPLIDTRRRAMSVYSAVPLRLGGVQGNDAGGRSRLARALCSADGCTGNPNLHSPSFPMSSNHPSSVTNEEKQVGVTKNLEHSEHLWAPGWLLYKKKHRSVKRRSPGPWHLSDFVCATHLSSYTLS
jgi:hypothetical protein